MAGELQILIRGAFRGAASFDGRGTHGPVWPGMRWVWPGRAVLGRCDLRVQHHNTNLLHSNHDRFRYLTWPWILHQPGHHRCRSSTLDTFQMLQIALLLHRFYRCTCSEPNGNESSTKSTGLGWSFSVMEVALWVPTGSRNHYLLNMSLMSPGSIWMKYCNQNKCKELLAGSEKNMERKQHFLSISFPSFTSQPHFGFAICIRPEALAAPTSPSKCLLTSADFFSLV